MDNNAFIDKKNFEVYEEHPDVFNCDKGIAKIIATLNQKGYKTKSSCEGHIEFNWVEYDDCDLELLPETFNNDSYIVLKVKEDGFDYLTRSEVADIYIAFAKNYNFKSLPVGFEVESDYGYLIRKSIQFYQDGVKRKVKDLEDEKNKYIKLLDSWVNNLPINEREDD